MAAWPNLRERQAEFPGAAEDAAVRLRPNASSVGLEVWFPAQVRYYRNPIEVVVARTPEAVAPALARSDEALRAGRSIVTYEAGVALEGGALAHQLRPDVPLLVLGVFAGPHRLAPAARTQDAVLGPLLTPTTWEEYRDDVVAIKSAIRDGDVYQVNLTVPFTCSFAGDPLALFGSLVARAEVPHAAFVRHGARAIVSCSPELFLEFRGTTVLTKPMKGTSAPGARRELENAKNRAEHVMIVDLMRNDLGRLGPAPRTTGLFTIENYPTFATMTTTIASDLGDAFELAQVFAATLPGGSITGAPKHAAIAQIAQREKAPRGIAMGTIGFQDGRDGGVWNTAIRTLDIDTDRGEATIRIGGGIVGDSEPRAEWAEILVKRRVFDVVAPPVGIIETLRVTRDGTLVRLDRHLARLERTAFAFGLTLSVDAARAALLDAARTPRSADALLRLSLEAGAVAVAERPLEAPPNDVTIAIAPQRLDTRDRTLRYKTTRRSAYDDALAHAVRNGCFEAVLLGREGFVADCSRMTLFVARDGALRTPPLAHGALAGILREELLADGTAVESPVAREDLASEAVFIGNSARGLLSARLVGDPQIA
jgi:para-aminobenzoate synthetase/4-amino-4-deoxychorismate lyase